MWQANFREGLSIFEYVTSARGSRKGLTDSALKTADAGYLTRRLVDVSHEAITRIHDCETRNGITISMSDKRTAALHDRISGRVTASDVVKPNSKEVLIEQNTVLDDEKVAILAKNKITGIKLRSPLTCQAKYGICQMCYGWDLTSLKLVDLGTPVGIVAAQSIGEPGTQLTLRVKHTGGVIGLDVTQGLPRVEELFESRIPKNLSPIAEIPGKVSIKETENGYEVTVRSVEEKPALEKTYIIPLSMQLRVTDKSLIAAGEQLAGGFLDLREVLRVRGIKGAQQYLLSELQSVYESQGITINDKHFEIIIREMSDKIRIKDAGDSTLLIGEVVDRVRFEEENGFYNL